MNDAYNVNFTFTDQKNAIKGDIVNQSRSNHPTVCPVLATIRRITHLRNHNAPDDTPIYTYYDAGSNKPKRIYPSHITQALQAVAKTMEATTGVPHHKISARSLRSGGATALLQCGADEKVIRLLGRWRSDSMFVYLRTQSESTTADFANKMLYQGKFRIPAADSITDEPTLLPEGLPQRMLQAFVRLELEDLGLYPKQSAYTAEAQNRSPMLTPSPSHCESSTSSSDDRKPRAV